MRLDKWLWFARLAATRGKAQQLCLGGHVRVDGRAIGRGAVPVHPGQVVAMPLHGHVAAVRIEALPGARQSPAAARLCYTALIEAPHPALAQHPGFRPPAAPATPSVPGASPDPARRGDAATREPLTAVAATR